MRRPMEKSGDNEATRSISPLDTRWTIIGAGSGWPLRGEGLATGAVAQHFCCGLGVPGPCGKDS
jgi:hypothetical protein